MTYPRLDIPQGKCGRRMVPCTQRLVIVAEGHRWDAPAATTTVGCGAKSERSAPLVLLREEEEVGSAIVLAYPCVLTARRVPLWLKDTEKHFAGRSSSVLYSLYAGDELRE